MENKICSCFGHRDICGVVPNFSDVLETLILNENISIFMTGGMGSFDGMFASTVRTLKKRYENIQLLLVKAYFSGELNRNKDYYDYMFDEIIIPDVVAGAHPKSAITKRNRWMVEQSDVVVTYVYRNFGGAYSAVRYAEKLKKAIIPLYK